MRAIPKPNYQMISNLASGAKIISGIDIESKLGFGIVNLKKKKNGYFI